MMDWKKVWDEWDIRGFIILSLLLQATLIIAAPLRKRTGSKFVAVPLWSAYLLADWVATFALGLIAKGQGRQERSGAFANPDYLLAFWAPFLLVHLGGPDTITAFALEDNELWKRHILQLVFQSLLAGYVFVLTASKFEKNLLVATVLMFVAGLINYIERTRSMYLASTGRFRKSLLTRPGSANLMLIFSKLPPVIPMIQQPLAEIVAAVIDKRNLTELQAVRHAYRFSKTFKGLLAGLILSFRKNNQSGDFFLNRTAKDAFRVVEVELNFFYEILYTKVPVIRGLLGFVLRFISFSSVVVALVLFSLTDKKGLQEVDVRITYALLYGGIALDTIAFFMLIFSDGTAVEISEFLSRSHPILFFLIGWQRWTEDSTQPGLVMRVVRRRWSESVSQYNLIYYCLHPRSKKKEKFIDFFGLTDILDGLKYVKTERFTKGLRSFIFDELKQKSKMAKDFKTAKEMYSAKGNRVLQIEECETLLPNSAETEYDEILLLWHIATEICYNHDKGNDQNKEFREFSKLLSDYMLFLLIMNPKLMSAVAGIGEIRFRDTCDEAKEFFKIRKIGKEETQSCPDILCCFKKCCCKEEAGEDKEHEEACKSILDDNTDIKPVTGEGDRNKSTLFAACILAKKLRDLKNKDKWNIMSKVWVELLSYAASHCRVNAHAAQLSQGGQLLTLVWLLMAHLGLGEQF